MIWPTIWLRWYWAQFMGEYTAVDFGPREGGEAVRANPKAPNPQLLEGE